LIIPVAVLVLLPHTLLSERLNSNTELIQEISKKPVVLLYAGVEMDSDYPSSSYVEVALFILVQKKDFIDIERIRKGTVLADTNGTTIGKALADFDALVVDAYSPMRIIVMLSGYIPQTAIDSSSIAEFELDKLVRNTADIVSLKSLLPHIKTHKYRRWMNYDGFSSYVKFDSALMGSPGHRALLVFFDERLFAIIHPNTITKSRVFPFRSDYVVIQYFTSAKAQITKFENGFFFQYKSAG